MFPPRQLDSRPTVLCAERFVPGSSRFIQTLSIFFYHTVRIEHRRYTPNRLAHQLNPRDRNPSVRVSVVKRHTLVLQDMKEAIGIDIILVFRRSVGDFGPNRPAVLSVVTLAPPTVEHAEV